jgi:ABC-type lipopolysaccharide export system ATPase subunit
VAHFSPLVTRSILALNYRQFDYHTMMSHSTQMARWMHKRLAHNYINASLIQSYTILFSTIQHESGLLEYKEQRHAVRKLNEALNELKAHHILLSVEKNIRRGERGRIVDVAYVLTPHPNFVAQTKAANKRQNKNILKNA